MLSIADGGDKSEDQSVISSISSECDVAGLCSICIVDKCDNAELCPEFVEMEQDG
jgi:hypothetical protein